MRPLDWCQLCLIALNKPVPCKTNAEGTCDQLEYENVGHEIFSFGLTLAIPFGLFSRLEKEKDALEKSIFLKTTYLMSPYKHDEIRRVTITPRLGATDGWRNQAQAWLSGEDVSNHGRTLQFAPCSHDGLLFRCAEAVHLYESLKGSPLMFAPLPVVVVGGKSVQRMEPDFIVIGAQASVFVRIATLESAALLTNGSPGVRLVTVLAHECDTPEKASKILSRLSSLVEPAPAQRL